MSVAHLHKSHLPKNDVPDESEPRATPVQPDDGPVRNPIPEYPVHDRTATPETSQPRQPRPTTNPLR